jgi:serine/threonine-protein kinase
LKFVRRQTLGSFEIIAHLDTGGMAEVYLARDPKGTFAVVKLLAESLKIKEDLVAMFKEEGRILTRLAHPNIVKVLSLGEEEGLPYIAMEYLAGDHLGVLSLMANKHNEILGASLIARIFLQVANGLAYVHEARDELDQPLSLVHRDISPPNILICYDGRVKLLDFGIAWVARRDRITRTGMVKGKIHYMSPEQINAKPLDRRSDLFSVGIVLWETVTGRYLTRDTSDFQVMKMICEKEIPPPSSFRFDLPADLEAIIMRCLERDPGRRFQSAVELRQALSDFLFAGTDPGRPDELPRTAERLLGERKERKDTFIQSIQRESTLREHLFGDLDDEFREAEDTEEVPLPEAAPEPDEPPEEPSGEDGPEPRRSVLKPVLLILAGLLVLLVILWISWPTGESPAPVVEEPEPAVQEVEPVFDDPGPGPGPEPEPEPEEDGGAAVEAAEATEEPEPEPPPPEVGWLHFDTKPQTDVFLKNRHLGKTPIRDLELKPGRYRLELVNPDAGIKKYFTVRIRKGQVTSHRIIY